MVIIGTTYATGETLIDRHADTVDAVRKAANNTGHNDLKRGPDGNIRVASILTDV